VNALGYLIGSRECVCMPAADSCIADYIGRWRPSSFPPEAAVLAQQVVADCGRLKSAAPSKRLRLPGGRSASAARQR
jgi:hypothetical protein